MISEQTNKNDSGFSQFIENADSDTAFERILETAFALEESGVPRKIVAKNLLRAALLKASPKNDRDIQEYKTWDYLLDFFLSEVKSHRKQLDDWFAKRRKK